MSKKEGNELVSKACHLLEGFPALLRVYVIILGGEGRREKLYSTEGCHDTE